MALYTDNMMLYTDNMALFSAMIICYNSYTELKIPYTGLTKSYNELKKSYRERSEHFFPTVYGGTEVSKTMIISLFFYNMEGSSVFKPDGERKKKYKPYGKSMRMSFRNKISKFRSNL